MYLVVGLGNPGDEYRNTRHNVGFDAIDLISSKYNISVNRIKFRGMYGEGSICGEKAILLKPITYMNLSGESISEVINFYKIPAQNIIVIYDDISLNVGRLRLRASGSSGGHNGVKSIIKMISSEEFPRIKIGVGQPTYGLIDYVLGRFSKEERVIIDQVLTAGIEAVELIINKGMAEAMNRFNGYKVENSNN